MSPANVDNVFRSITSIIRQSFASALQTFFAGTDPLPVANGGTGVTTLSGILSAIGGLSDVYRDLPIVTKTGAFTFANAERANGVYYTGAAAAATIDPNATTAINTGAVYVIHNNGSGALTITRGAGVTLKVNGGTSSANATLAIGGEAYLKKWVADYWTVSGSGVS
jgi:hypothetical protein